MSASLHDRRASGDTLGRHVSGSSATSPAEDSASTTAVGARQVWALLRIILGWIFLWAFLDKTFGLGAAIESENAWIDGGSPTEGFLTFGTRGPLKDWFDWMAGETWADWLFMIGLLSIGLALTLGIGMRLAAASGSTLLVFMWAAMLWPENNPFVSDHIVYAIALVGLALVNAGDTWGLGRWWAHRPVVRNHPVLR